MACPPGDEGVSTAAGANPWQLALHSYDSEGRLADKWIWTGDRTEWDTQLSYDYNRLGELTRLKITIGTQTLYQHYSYDQRGLLSTVTLTTDGTADTEAAEVTYTYTATGAVDKIDYRGSKDADYGYTIRDWVESINSVGTPGGNFAASYNYADNGNVSKAEFHNPQIQSGGGTNTVHWNFSYDQLNRLTGADFGTGTSSSSSKFDVAGLAYDKAGNITALKRDEETGSLIDDLTYSYAAGTNRLQTLTYGISTTSAGWDAESATFGYDPNGNPCPPTGVMTSQTGKFTDIAYEHRNLPTHFDLSNGSDLYAGYNADGQRVLKESSGGTWQFYVMDGPQTLAVIDQNGFSHFNLVGNSTFGRWEPGGTRRYYISDHLGSTRAVTDDTGNILETFDYYPFGLLMPRRSSTTGNTLEKFTGKERDESIGLDYFGFRYYDPALARWISVDPKADEFPAFSPYNYTLNNPINLFDPDGQAPTCPRCDIMQDIRNYERLGVKKPQGDPKTTAQVFDFMGRTLVEPYDWVRTGVDWAQGNGSAWDALALLPFLSGGTDDLVRTGNRLFKGSTRVADHVGDNTVVIGKVDDLKQPGAIGEGESTLLDVLPDQGSPKANWKQNSSVLREAMGLGRPIRDASVDPKTGELINNTGFLKAERNLLREQGWSYNKEARLWEPPQQ